VAKPKDEQSDVHVHTNPVCVGCGALLAFVSKRVAVLNYSTTYDLYRPERDKYTLTLVIYCATCAPDYDWAVRVDYATIAKGRWNGTKEPDYSHTKTD
jgi:hypothetical protein